jgi:hypothetical protein
MPPNDDVYVDLKGRALSLAKLSGEERQLVAELRKRASAGQDWNAFDTFWLRAVADFYDAQGLSRQESRQTIVYRIAQDLSARLAVAAGLARPPDYRDELEELIRTRFKSRRAFCEATGISEDMLSHVLARRKHLSMEALGEALDRIGYTIHISPRDGSTNPQEVPV